MSLVIVRGLTHDGIVSPSTGVSRKEELGIDRKFHFSDLDHPNVCLCVGGWVGEETQGILGKNHFRTSHTGHELE